MTDNGRSPYTLGCFGAPGSYSDAAMRRHFNDVGRVMYYDHFEDLVRAVASGERTYGVLPVENSSTGGIAEVYDLVWRYECRLVGEEYIRVQHQLLGLKEAALSDIEEVYSHPQGFAQCYDFLRKHPEWRLHTYFSTAQSAGEVAAKRSKTAAAIAGKQAAELYGLKILVPDIAANKTNYTRFIIISAADCAAVRKDKLTVVVITEHVPGALYHVLGHFFHRHMNMTHLESRPIPGRPFEYSFHIDVTGSLDEVGTAEAVEELKRHCKYLKILGNYPSAKGGMVT